MRKLKINRIKLHIFEQTQQFNLSKVPYLSCSILIPYTKHVPSPVSLIFVL